MRPSGDKDLVVSCKETQRVRPELLKKWDVLNAKAVSVAKSRFFGYYPITDPNAIDGYKNKAEATRN